MKGSIALLLSITFFIFLPACKDPVKSRKPATFSADVVIYGGTSSAVIAAVQVVRWEKRGSGITRQAPGRYDALRAGIY